MDGMQEHATALADAVEVALPGWVERCVEARVRASQGRAPTNEVRAAAAAAGRRAVADVVPRLRALLEADIDRQVTNPLSLLRGAVQYPTEVLRQAGVPAVERDEMQERMLPEDPYDLAPASFADVDPALSEPGIVWGAAKAYEHIRRHGGGRGLATGGGS